MIREPSDVPLATRARIHGALAEPARVAIVDLLIESDQTPTALGAKVGISSNLLAHHLDVLEAAGLISRHRSSGDQRRRYVCVDHTGLEAVSYRPATVPDREVLFVCTHNSARSPLAAALWQRVTGSPAASAGTHPAPRVHPGAVASARRAGIDIRGSVPTLLDAKRQVAGTVITVCDQAHEEVGESAGWIHWSVADPVGIGTAAAFDAARDELRGRIDALATSRAGT